MTLKQQALWHVIRMIIIMITVAVLLAMSLYYVGLVLTGVLIMMIMLGYVLHVVYHMELRRLEAEELDRDRRPNSH